MQNGMCGNGGGSGKLARELKLGAGSKQDQDVSATRSRWTIRPTSAQERANPVEAPCALAWPWQAR
jgi:hypothetical protein